MLTERELTCFVECGWAWQTDALNPSSPFGAAARLVWELGILSSDIFPDFPALPFIDLQHRGPTL